MGTLVTDYFFNPESPGLGEVGFPSIYLLWKGSSLCYICDLGHKASQLGYNDRRNNLPTLRISVSCTHIHTDLDFLVSNTGFITTSM